MTISFERTADGTGIDIVDGVERHRYRLSTSATALAPADPERLLFPVDAAVEVTTDHVAVTDVPCMYVRDTDGGMLATTEPPCRRTFPEGEYYIEVCAPVKLYLKVTAPVTVEADLDGKRIEFGRETTVLVGGRSKHERPAATVTTTTDPEDVMVAVSTFGSALKTTSPERSFPTLRGHPPTVELGDRLAIPGNVEPPATGVRIEVPRDYQYVYAAAPLAYYLGARVVPGDRPRLVTDDGFSYDLGTGERFEREVERVLKGTFLLDCVTRTEGLYDLDLHERRAVESVVDLDFARLYEAPLAERLAVYLGVPYGTLEPYVPDWKLTTHVATTPDSVETLPFVVNDLAVVRTGTPGEAATPSLPTGIEAEHQAEAVDSFVRGPRSAAASPSTPTVVPASDDAMEHAWVGEGVPQGASKATVDAYRNRLDLSPTEGDIDITVVCNDPEMADERDVVDEVYGSREDLPFEVTVHERLATDELRAVLQQETAFFHYIGHIDEDGFECPDGTLDAATLESTGVEAFLLNACTSYDQGMELVEAGAVGGIVTLADVVNESAVEVGSTVARLLNKGYPLRPALEIAKDASYMGMRYIVVGDGGFCVAQSDNQTPILCEIERENGVFHVSLVTYTPSNGGMGDIVKPYVPGNEKVYLGSGEVDEFSLTKKELEEYLDDVPVKIDDRFIWGDQLRLEEL